MRNRMSRLLVLAFTLFGLGFGFTASAEGNLNGGDEFRSIAQTYTNLALEYKEKGRLDVAVLYQRMAEIKLQAATLADQNRWVEIDWSEYHQVEKEIATLLYRVRLT